MRKIGIFVSLTIIIGLAVTWAVYQYQQHRKFIPGEVLPGAELQSQVWDREDCEWVRLNPMEPHYVEGQPFITKEAFQNLPAANLERVVYAKKADARFNAEDARYRISFHLSNYGIMPDSAGDFNGDGVEDFITMSHFAYVDGKKYAGEVHIYFGKKNHLLDPRTQVPDIIFYGDQPGAKLGISVAAAGDINGDGKGDLALSAGFYDVQSSEGKTIENAGRVYVIYGGTIPSESGTTKVRVEDIATRLPGIVLEGGHDGSRYVAWANGLEAGDFNGDGCSDLIVGSYNPYPNSKYDFPARGYLLYGSKKFPSKLIYRLGVDKSKGNLISTTITAPFTEWTNTSMGFGASFISDINQDGLDDLALTTTKGGDAGKGATYIFFGRKTIHPNHNLDMTTAGLIISASTNPKHHQNKLYYFRGLGSARPAGDVNGDRIQDFYVSAKSTICQQGNQAKNVGAVGIFYGRKQFPKEMDFARADVIYYGSREGFLGQPAMDRGADITGDGYTDLLISDPYYKEKIGGKLQYRGRVWLMKGGPNLPQMIDVESNAYRIFVPDTRIPGKFGNCWNTGDWNGDGKMDIVIGDHFAGVSEGHIHSGITYMFYNDFSFNCEDFVDYQDQLSSEP